MTDLKNLLDDLDKPIWGAAAIGRVIERTEAQAFYLLESDPPLLDARKVKGRWTSTPRRLLRSLCGGEQTSTAKTNANRESETAT